MIADSAGSFTTAYSLPEKDTGVLKTSKMFLHLPSEYAQKMLYYAPYIGQFYCNDAYSIRRDNYDYYLFLLVDTGELHVSFGGNDYIARQRDMVLLDCKKPHAYRAAGSLSFRYFHFEGAQSADLYNLLIQRQGYILHPADQLSIESALNSILALAYDGYRNEYKISAQIHVILSELASQSMPEYDVLPALVITKAISYIEEHFIEDVSVEHIADTVNLSTYYFSRLFRKYTNMSPHSYIVKLRVTLAKQLLASTTQSIEQICYACGFNSTQHFTRCFRQRVGHTPGKYRKQTNHRGEER